MVFGASTNISFDRNIYFGVNSPDTFPDANALIKDPQFTKAGKVSGYFLKKIHQL